MNKINMNIWGRQFALEVVYQIFDQNQVSEIQKGALSVFASKDITQEVLEDVKNYVLQRDGMYNGIDYIDNIFKYVMPNSIFIPDSEERIIAIICDYKFDMEHGIAVVFKNEKLYEIGAQDIIL